MDSAIRCADSARWDEQSPCEDWTARQVAGHAITFIRNVVALAGDGAPPDFHAEVDFVAVAGNDPLVTWLDTRALVEAELLTRPDRLAAVRMTPLGVEMPIAQLLTFQGMDPVVHGWDIGDHDGHDRSTSPTTSPSSTSHSSRPSPTRSGPVACSAPPAPVGRQRLTDCSTSAGGSVEGASRLRQ